MTEYRSVDVVCGNCGTKQCVMQVICTREYGAQDFDTRPPRERRNTMHTWAVMCKTCGYCSNDLTRIEPIQKGFMQTQEQYRRELQTPLTIRPIMANIFVCASLLDEVKGDTVSACWNSLRAAWCCDDMEAAQVNPYMYERQKAPPTTQDLGEAMDGRPSEGHSRVGTGESTGQRKWTSACVSPPDPKRQSVYYFDDHCQRRDVRFSNYKLMVHNMELKEELEYSSGDAVSPSNSDSGEDSNNEGASVNGGKCEGGARGERQEEWSLTEYFRHNCANRYDYEPYLFQLDRDNAHLLYDPQHFNQSKKCRIKAILLLEQLRPRGVATLEHIYRNGSLLEEDYVRGMNAPLINNTFFSQNNLDVQMAQPQSIQYELWIQLMVDLLRRIGQFDTAGHLICNLKYKGPDPALRLILRFQLKLCKEKNSECHNFSEIF